MMWKRLVSLFVTATLMLPYCASASVGMASIATQAASEWRQRSEREARRRPAKPERRPIPAPAKVDPRVRGWWTADMRRTLAAHRQLRAIDEGSLAGLFATASAVASVQGYEDDPIEAGPPQSGEIAPAGSGSGTNGGQIGRGSLGVSGETNTATGNLLITVPLISWACRGDVGVGFSLYHNSFIDSDGVVGTGWSHAYEMSVFDFGNFAVVTFPDGLLVPYEYDETTNEYLRPDGFFAKLEPITSGGQTTGWKLTTKSNHVYRFEAADSAGRFHLTKVQDRYTNGIAISRDANAGQRVTSVKADNTSDTRILTFSYSATTGKLTSVSTGAREFLFNVDTQANGYAQSILKDIRTKFNGAPSGGEFYRGFKYDENPSGSPFTRYNIISEEGPDDSAEELIASLQAPPPTTQQFGWEYDSQQRVIKEVDGEARRTDYAYTELAGGLKQVVLTYAVGTSVQASETWVYTNNNYTQHTDEEGYVTEFEYDSDRNTTEVTSFLAPGAADDRVSSATYGAFGEVLSATDPEGHTTHYVWRTTDYQLQSIRMPGSTTPDLTYNYDSYGRLFSEQRKNGDILAWYVYDTWGQVKQIWEGRSPGLERITQVTYDANQTGDITKITDPNGVDVEYVYEYGRPTQVKVENTVKSQTSYDFWFRTTQNQDAEGNITEARYTKSGLLKEFEDPLGRVTKLAYNNAGQVDSVEWERTVGQTLTEEDLTFTYDARGRRASMTNANGGKLYYAYTPRGQLKQTAHLQVAPENSPATYHLEKYDYHPSGELHVFQSGEVVLNTPPTGSETLSNPIRNIDYTYNKRGLPTHIDYGQSPSINVTLSYDSWGRRTSMQDATGTSTWSFDPNKQLLTAFTSPAGTVQYEYNAAFDDLVKVKNLQAIGSEDIEYTYDLGGRLQTIKSPAGEITTLHYDAEGRLNKKQLPNGLDELYAYQNNDWVTSVEIRNRATQAAVDLQTYSYFDTGLVHQHARGLSPNVVTTTYGYDELGQLLSETRLGVTTSYTYDGNGNRLTKQVGSAAPEVYTYDLGDKLEQVSVNGTPVRTYGYDAEGRRISKTAGGQTTTYAWNADNRLTGIDLPTGNDPAYTYNGAGARVGRTAGATSNVFKRSGASATASVLQDGEASYVPGLSERRSGVTTFQHSNLKNVSAQSQTGTTLSATRTYDAFGSIESGTGTFVGPFGYGGGFGYQSTDGGLMLLGHRYYDPEDGRFISRDPIKDGRNWYSYCYNSPVNLVDPDGQIAWVPIIIAIVVIIDIIDAANDVKDIVDNPKDPLPYISLIGGMVDPTPGNAAKRGVKGVRAAMIARLKEAPPSIYHKPGDTRLRPHEIRQWWSEYHGGKPWPRDENGMNLDADHQLAKADGGSDHPININPALKRIHHNRHRDNGDFERWGGLGAKLKRERMGLGRAE